VDIMGALAIASQTIKVAKDLRDIERDVDSASYKAKTAELYTGLADLKIALSDAREELHERDAMIEASGRDRDLEVWRGLPSMSER